MSQKENTPNACKIMSVIGLGFSIAGLLCAIFMPLLLKFRSDANGLRYRKSQYIYMASGWVFTKGYRRHGR